MTRNSNQHVSTTEEFDGLFQEYLTTYFFKDVGKKHFESYDLNRAQGQTNFQEINEGSASGPWDDALTNGLLTKLLPHSNSTGNRERGAWIHVAPSFSGDVKVKFEGAKWAKPEDWTEIAQEIFQFIKRCSEAPGDLAAACEAFAASQYSKGFQTGALSPVLNALQPAHFVIVNSKPLRTLNYFEGTSYPQTIAKYPEVNEAVKNLVAERLQPFQKELPKDALLTDVFDEFCHWLVAVKKFSFKSNGEATRYWKIAPGDNAWNWEVWKDEGIATIGWDEIGDISGIKRAEFESRRDQVLEKNDNWTKTGIEQVWKFARHIHEGDWIVANRGTSDVLGFGRVVGSYYFVPGERHGHRLPVEWDDTEVRKVSEGGWRRTLVELDAEKFQAISSIPPDINPQSAFSERAFTLLDELHLDPKAVFYSERKEDFNNEIEKPLRLLMAEVAEKLPEQIKDKMETEKKIFSRIPKNDYGKGGAWDFYWGAFFPKGGKRIEDAQLFIWMNRNLFNFGFYIGEYGSEQRNRFLKNCKQYSSELLQLLKSSFSEVPFSFGGSEELDDVSDVTLESWLMNPATSSLRAAVSLSKSQLLSLSRSEVVEQIADVFVSVFPLVILAISEAPMGLVAAFLEPESPEIQPEYSLEEFAKETGYDESILRRWVKALERKDQAVFYGPPGTGKTYVAERLAKHIVGGGDGFTDLIQFHPAYAYEDFIQGIRPQGGADGKLEYPMVPGRFVNFCEEARSRKGPCVLIIDEINRANLARVFGELMYLLEYRGETIPLAGGEGLRIPNNVYLIGTMNTADRSIALVDHALRRRFAFLGLYPNYEILQKFHSESWVNVEGLVRVLKRVNQQIADKHYEVGISFFLTNNLDEHLEDIWKMEIEPYLEEYFYDQPEKVDSFRWEKVKEGILP